MKFIIRCNAEIESISRFSIWRSAGAIDFSRSNMFSLVRQHSISRWRVFGVIYSGSMNWSMGRGHSLWIL